MQNRAPGNPHGFAGRSYIESDDYLARNGYLDSRGNTRSELITEAAKKVADELDRERLNYAQLRRFFAKIRYIELVLDAGSDFEDVRTKILELIPAAAYAVNRGVAPTVFRTFVEKNVTLSQRDEPNFRKGLVQHFQSVVCFFPRQSGQ